MVGCENIANSASWSGLRLSLTIRPNQPSLALAGTDLGNMTEIRAALAQVQLRLGLTNNIFVDL